MMERACVTCGVEGCIHTCPPKGMSCWRVKVEKPTCTPVTREEFEALKRRVDMLDRRTRGSVVIGGG